MKAVTAVVRLGGTATRQQLRLAGVHWRFVDEAVESGALIRSARGHYVLPTVEEGRSAAHRLAGAASHTTAALHWGWKVKLAPAQPHVTVRRKRSLPAGLGDGVTIHWRDLDADDVLGWVTSPVRTVIDCCLDLPLDEALSVFDSARRAGVSAHEVSARAAWLPKRQRDRVSRVAGLSDPRAANPFESVLRAIALQVKGLMLVPQVRIGHDRFWARVDLADEHVRIVLEADSHEFHTKRQHFDRDCRRYNGLTVGGWLVLRFSWEQVMFEPDLVREVIERAVALRRSQGVWRTRSGQPAGMKRRNAAKTG
jgi:very-short-patch-repair endonuclease